MRTWIQIPDTEELESEVAIIPAKMETGGSQGQTLANWGALGLVVDSMSKKNNMEVERRHLILISRLHMHPHGLVHIYTHTHTPIKDKKELSTQQNEKPRHTIHVPWSQRFYIYRWKRWESKETQIFYPSSENRPRRLQSSSSVAFLLHSTHPSIISIVQCKTETAWTYISD